jgi:hypothetical protein
LLSSGSRGIRRRPGLPARRKIRRPDNNADQHRQQPYFHCATSFVPGARDEEAVQAFKERLLERGAAPAYLRLMSEARRVGRIPADGSRF